MTTSTSRIVSEVAKDNRIYEAAHRLSDVSDLFDNLQRSSRGGLTTEAVKAHIIDGIYETGMVNEILGILIERVRARRSAARASMAAALAEDTAGDAS